MPRPLYPASGLGLACIPIYKVRGLHPRLQVVLCQIWAEYEANPDARNHWITIENLALYCGIPIPAVKSTIRELVAIGWMAGVPMTDVLASDELRKNSMQITSPVGTGRHTDAYALYLPAEPSQE